MDCEENKKDPINIINYKFNDIIKNEAWTISMKKKIIRLLLELLEGQCIIKTIYCYVLLFSSAPGQFIFIKKLMCFS